MKKAQSICFVASSCCSFTVASNSLQPIDCSRPDFPVFHYLLEFAQTHVHWISDAIQPSHLLSPPSPAFNLSQHQSFPVSWLFASGGQSIGTSASALVLPVNIQGWFPLGLTSLIFLPPKGFSRVFSSTIVQKHQLFGTQPSLWSNSHIHPYMTTGKIIALTRRTFVSKVMSLFFNTLSLS